MPLTLSLPYADTLDQCLVQRALGVHGHREHSGDARSGRLPNAFEERGAAVYGKLSSLLSVSIFTSYFTLIFALITCQVREHLTEESSDDLCDQRQFGHGSVKADQMMNIRWNSQYGSIYVDGSHYRHDLELGDEIKIDGHAPYLQIFEYRPKT